MSDQTLIRAIEALDADDPTAWTRSGKPSCRALAKALGHRVSARSRDTAWATVQAQRQQAEAPPTEPVAVNAPAAKPSPANVEARITDGYLYWSTPAEVAEITALARKGKDVLRRTPVVGTGRAPIAAFALSAADLAHDEFSFLLVHEAPHRSGATMRVDSPFFPGPAKDSDATTVWDPEWQAPNGPPSPAMDAGYDARAQYDAQYLEPDGPLAVWDRGALRTREPADLYPHLQRGDIVYYARWDVGACTFERWDGGMAVITTGKERLNPDAPPAIPRLGATPAGARIWTSPVNLLVARDV